MSTHSPSNRAALRAFVIVASSLLVLVAGGLDLRRIWIPLGDFGYDINGDGRVTYVEAASPAARAGMQVGDNIDLQSTPAQFRFFAAFSTAPATGQSFAFGLIHKGVRRTIMLTATRGTYDEPDAVYRIGAFFVALLFITLGVALVWLRPSIMTWGFFVYCLSATPFTFTAVEVFFPFPWPYVANYIFLTFLFVAGDVGLLIFALCFLNEPIKGWRLSALRLMPWLFAALFIFAVFSTYQFTWIGGPPGELLNRIFLVIRALILLVALCLFVATYVRARGADRQRMRWIVVAFILSIVFSYAQNFLGNYAPSTPVWAWVIRLLSISRIIVPLAVTYAVIKHRVIDVSFVVNRALVYGILTTLVVGVFSIIDWLFIEKMRLARLGTIMELGVAVAGGFWFNGLHKRVDVFVDATFFRHRHKAEQQLARNAAALPLAPSTSAVAHFLVNEPVRSMSLASAALFRQGRDGEYVREESVGWDTSNLSRLDAADEPVLMLAQAEGGPLSLYDHPWRTQGVPSGPAHPVLALPIIVRRELTAVVFYGAHIHGEPLDPDEIRVIAGLSPGAAAAYDHLEAERLRNDNESIRRENESLRTQLAEAEIQPA